MNIASANEESAKKAITIIQELTATAELNKTYMGKVQRITDVGAFVEIMPGTPGMRGRLSHDTAQRRLAITITARGYECSQTRIDAQDDTQDEVLRDYRKQ